MEQIASGKTLGIQAGSGLEHSHGILAPYCTLSVILVAFRLKFRRRKAHLRCSTVAGSVDSESLGEATAHHAVAARKQRRQQRVSSA